MRAVIWYDKCRRFSILLYFRQLLIAQLSDEAATK